MERRFIDDGDVDVDVDGRGCISPKIGTGGESCGRGLGLYS